MTSSPSHFSEDFSDSGTSTPLMTCIEDDQEFIRNAKEGNMVSVEGKRMIKGGARVAFLWSILEQLPSSLQKRVFLKLLQGNDEGDDIWLWNEGDEAVIGNQGGWTDLPWTTAATALERHLAQTPVQTPRREKVQSSVFELRAAMISWLVLTSMAYKSVNEDVGAHHCGEWDMQAWIRAWWLSLPGRVDQWLVQHSKSYDDQAFTEAMDQAGHRCHKQMSKWVRWWLFMRSQLLPAQQDHIIYLRHRYCRACLAQ
ncbi:hypothetical protein C8J56DRAFT_961133 [Mycena floridula]|nr:hypothetical protein C8J56DRAFT_961133 [Mycena floridula]